MKVKLLFILLLLSACQPKEKINVESRIRVNSNKAEMLSLIENQMEQRFAKFGIEVLSSDLDAENNEIIFQTQMDEEKLELHSKLFNSYRFDLWDVHDLEDPVMKEINWRGLNVNGFQINLLESLILPKEVLGLAKDKNRLKEISAVIMDSLSQIPNIKLLWSDWKKTPPNEGYYLYAMDRTKAMNPLLTESEVVNAEVAEDAYSSKFVVNLQLNEIGAKKFLAVTTKAYNDNKAAIALVLNDEVIFCPRVNTPITGGKATIASFDQVEKADIIAIHMGLNRLPAEINLLDNKTIETKE